MKEILTNIIYNVDSIKGMDLLPKECINAIITDPPYLEQDILIFNNEKGGEKDGWTNY